MYERAADERGTGPLWHVEGARTFFAGPLTYNAGHQHGAPVFLAGLYGPFRLRVGEGAWTVCRTAMIPAGVLHELDLGGDPLGVLYVEPDGAGADDLVPLLAGTRETSGALVGTGGTVAPLRDLYENRDGVREAGAALTDLLGFSRARARRGLDGRVARAVALLRARSEPTVSVTEIAHAVGLSPSRFQHLFTGEVGVPFRRYRAWLRMRRAIQEIVAGASFTAASHEAGFADQAHLAHDFRRTFGAPASRSLLNVRR